MRKHLLMSTVALLAGLAVASAQQMPGGDGQRSGAAQKQERGATTSAQKEQSREGEAGRSKSEAQGKQGERGQQGKSGESKSSTTGQGGREQSKQAEPQNKQRQQGKQAEQGKSGESKSSTTGQGSREQQGKQAEPQSGKKGQQGKNADRGKSEQGKQGADSKGGTTGQADREPGRQAEPKTDQRDRQGQTGQSQQGRQDNTAGQRGSEQGSVQLTNEQRTQVREQVLTRNAPRVDNVNFSVRVGTAVPTSVRVVAVPDVLIRIHPDWRGHRYFVVRDEIVIVDNSHRIVSVLPVGSSGGAQLDNRDRGSAGVRSGGAMNLSVEEIREVQQVLVREGFDVEVDGRLGRKTHDALISFQRKSGLQATGQIDTQTVTKLGVNVRGSGQSTTGQGGGRQEGRDNMPSREQGQQGRQDQQGGGDRSNQRSDQDRRGDNAPSNTQGRNDQRSEQDRNANAPSTTGQGGQQGGERGNMARDQGNMPKGQQDGSQNRRDREK